MKLYKINIMYLKTPACLGGHDMRQIAVFRLVPVTSPFHEQNDTHAVNRTCEQFCVCDSHTCLSH